MSRLPRPAAHVPPRAFAFPARKRTGSRCAWPPRRNACRLAFLLVLTAAGDSPECKGSSDISRPAMSILTDHELDFLASLNTRWSRLYWSELAFLLSENDADRPAERFRILNGLDALGHARARDRVRIVVD